MHIHRLDHAGGGEPQLLHSLALPMVRSMAWSPDRSALLIGQVIGRSFLLFVPDNVDATYVLTPLTKDILITAGPTVPTCWSPDGGMAFFARHSGVHVLDYSGPRAIITPRELDAPDDAEVVAVSISPDALAGVAIFFARGRHAGCMRMFKV